MTDNLIQLLNINELYWKGKSATETFLIAIPIFLVALVLLGYFIAGRKKAKVQAIIIGALTLSAFNSTASAMCPVCTVAIGAGLGFSRVLGIDDLITSIWMGGLVVSTVNWILSWLEKRKIKSWKATAITYIIMYALVFIPLQIGGTIGAAGNIIFGIDKVLLGIILGTIFFIIGMLIHYYLKSKNNAEAYFPFQKVVFPVSFLWIATVIAYYITYYLI